MAIDWLIERMSAAEDRTAIVWRGHAVSYTTLLEQVRLCEHALTESGVKPGDVVALEGDYSPGACALLLALVARGAILVPLTRAVGSQREEFLDIAEVQVVGALDDDDRWRFERRNVAVTNPLTQRLINSGDPGLVLFSSGSTGKSKAALHNFAKLLEKFKVPRQQKRTLTFLLLDHIGGINTLLYTLSNGGTVVAVSERDPDTVCEAIAHSRVEILPTSPTFINLLLISGALDRHDLSSLELITYGTEVMPESTLQRVHELLPGVRLLQTYGLSELGILRSKSRDSGSLWVKVGGEGYETKVVDGTLWIRAQSAMLGYLNAPSPFDSDGWMNTQDQVEVDGEWLRILGRRSEIINVGGQKVYPAEVESVLLQMDNVSDAAVRGQPNPITGQIVVASLTLKEPEDGALLKRRVRAFCGGRLAAFKVPVRIEVSSEGQHNARFKRVRREHACAN